MAVVRVATCQFPVSADVGGNLGYIQRQLRVAARRGADLAHFPEAALSGYAGVDFTSFTGFTWDELRQAGEQVRKTAAQLGIWVVFGSAHQLGDGLKPHNCLYVVNDSGDLVDRYDKRFCSGDLTGRHGDLAHYTPGDHAAVWEVRGVRCAALICYDYRFPELYRDYVRRGVRLVLHSFHAARVSDHQLTAISAKIGTGLARLHAAATHTYPGITMPAAMTAAAACNHVWISCPNSSARQSLWPAFFVRADGITTGRLRRNTPGVLISTVDTDEDLYDSARLWRQRAIDGVWHSGETIDHPRSRDRGTI